MNKMKKGNEEEQIKKLNRKLKAGVGNQMLIYDKIHKLRKTLGEHKHSWNYSPEKGTSFCSICGEWK